MRLDLYSCIFPYPGTFMNLYFPSKMEKKIKDDDASNILEYRINLFQKYKRCLKHNYKLK